MNIYTAKFTAFVYRWNQKSTGKWYIGSRTAKGCHINDGYTCSSKIVKPLIESNHGDWSREILAMGEHKFMVQVEAEILQELNARNDPDSYNLHNGDGKFSTTGSDEIKEKLSRLNRTKKWWNNGSDQRFCADSPNQSYSRGRLPFNNLGSRVGADTQRGKFWINDGVREYMTHNSELPNGHNIGRIRSKAFGGQQRHSCKGTFWWNNGMSEHMQKDSPGLGYTRGRLSTSLKF